MRKAITPVLTFVLQFALTCAVVLNGSAQNAAQTARANAARGIPVPAAGMRAMGLANAAHVTAGAARGTHTGNPQAQPFNSPQAPLFLPATTYAAGGYATGALVAGDVNGDGTTDLVVANHCAAGSGCLTFGSLGVLLGNGDGTFQAAQAYSSGGILPESVAIADIDGDGKADIVVANRCGTDPNCQIPAGIGVLLGNGDGTFQAAQSHNSGGYYTFFASVGDFNGDGKPDLVAANECGDANCQSIGGLGVLLGNGDGSFQAAQVYDAGGVDPFSVIVSDVNGDGKADLLALNVCGRDPNCAVVGGISVLLGNGDGTYQSAQVYSSGGYTSQSMAAADVNGDGKADVVVANSCGGDHNCLGHGSLSVLLGNGDGTFQAEHSYDSGGYGVNSVAVGDVNGDGKPDLVSTNPCANDPTCSGNGSTNVLLGNGDGTFQTAQSYDSGTGRVISVAISDVNGDGKADVAASHSCQDEMCSTGSVSVLLRNLATTSLSAGPPNPAYGELVTLTAAVTPNSPGTATGTITFLEGATTLGTANLVSGQASMSTSALLTGTHALTASYGGDSNFPGSVSSPASLTVSKAGTQSLLSSSPNPSIVGQTVTFTATIVPASGSGPSGTVSFYDGATLLGSGAMSGGVAAFSTSSLTQGTHSIAASYSGDSNFNGSTSVALSQGVQLATSTGLASSLNPSTFGQQVIFTATVTSSGGAPQGTVTFTANNKLLGTVTLLGGSAILGTSNLKVGSLPIVATYSGSDTFRGSTATLIQVVNGAVTTTTTITGSSLNPSTYGDAVTFSATVTSNSGTPAGSVRFKAGSKVLGLAVLSNGVATLTASPGQLPGGAVAIVATYLANGQFSSSTSAAFFQTVNPAGAATSLASSANPSVPGQAVTFTATVSGAYAIPTGRARFRDGSKLLATIPLTNGVAVYTTAALSAGTHNITVSYSGDSNYAPGSANVQQLVQ